MKIKNLKLKIINKLAYLPLIIGGTPYPTPTNLPKANSINQFVSFAISLIITIGIVASIIYLLLGTIKWITSGGDKAKIEEAKGTITYALIGIIVVTAAFVILSLLGQLLEIPYLRNIDYRQPPEQTTCPRSNPNCNR